MTNNSIRVKKINQELIKEALKTMKCGTKSMIASATGLSVATCGNILNEFLETGEVIKTELDESSGGRPARRYEYNANYSYIACLFASSEGGVHKLTFVVANLIGSKIDEGCREVNAADAEAIHDLVDELIAQYSEIRALGIGIPGFVHQGIINVCDIAELLQVPLEAQLKEKYDIEVTIDNDMNLTAYGFSKNFYTNGHQQEDQSLVVITFPKNNFPGAGVMIGGYIHRGATQFAGEVSFLPYGISREEQIRRLHQPDTFVPLASQTVASMIAIINPQIIALTGDLIQVEHIAGIYEHCLQIIPKEHMPEIIVLEQSIEMYLNGLIAVTLESLSYHLELIEKRR